jgi:NADPH:quinone reductase-like Zn-dependent oxidoreductase
MRAVAVRAPGGPEALVLEEVPPPEPRPGEVRTRVEACGVCFHDALLHGSAGWRRLPY